VIGAPVTEGLGLPFGHGREFQDFIDLTAPAAGANKAFVIPGEFRMRVVAAKAQLDTDANAANRLLSLDFIGQRGTTYVRNAAPVLVAASTVAQVFQWSAQRDVSEWNSGTPVFVPLQPLFLEPGMVVQFTVDSKQAGDALTALSLVVEKWPTGYRGEPVGTVRG
jgi:hypothetical protein